MINRNHKSKQMVHQLFYFLLVGFFMLLSTETGAQELNSMDLSRVKSSDISDAQLKAYMERGEKEGISFTEAMNMARARGMSASVANELLRRAQTLETQNGQADAAPSTLRNGDIETEQELIELPEDTLEIAEPEGPLIFGKSLFSQSQRSFEPSMNIPTPVNYVLGPGDELVVDIWGATANLHQLEVSPEGTVTIDNQGPVYVHGLTIEEANDRIMEKLKQLYRGLGQNTFARVSLGRVRSIQVTVIGEVEKPGSYTVSSLATVFNVLYKAGGPNEIGSFRQVEVMRNNSLLNTLDIYDLLLRGDQTSNVRLHDQDVIRVATIQNRVKVSGHVRRPGLYEVTPGETLDQLIGFTGSYTDSAYTQQVRVKRNTEREFKMLTVERADFNSFTLNNGDEVQVDRILDRFENRVSISGAVWRPGDFELTEGMMLSELIAMADGVKPDVFRSRAVINRLTENFDYSIVSFNVDQVLNQPDRYDMALQPEDQVIIKSIHEMREELEVSLGGEVRERGVYQFRKGMTLEDLILMADGFLGSASEARIEINRRIFGEAAPESRGSQLAEIFVFGVERDLSMAEATRSFELMPFDQVYVRARPDYQVQEKIRVEGQILFPGEYALSDRNERISDLIRRAGGLTDEAYVRGATLLRARKQLERVETDVELGSLVVIDKDADVQNYIGINLEDILKNPGSEDDLFLRPGDVVRIPSELQTVRVSGGVLRDSEIRHNKGRLLKYYVEGSGGYSPNARRAKSYVVYANGDVATRGNFLFFSTSPKIEPGSEIVVPQRIERAPMSPGERIAILSTVVSMAAVVMTAISRF
jgi:protein involved in polysaccharide export with SLBB domain